MRVLLIILIMVSTCQARALDEVNYWREKNGLPPFKEDKSLTEFAQSKAEYRALHKLHDGHDGPKCPDGCIEGVGQAKAHWGWLTCAMEDRGEYAGAGIATDGKERYMVLVIRGDGGPLLNPNNIKTIDTSFLTPCLPILK